MIAALKGSVLDGRKRPKLFDRARHDHAFIFSRSSNFRPSLLSTAVEECTSRLSPSTSGATPTSYAKIRDMTVDALRDALNHSSGKSIFHFIRRRSRKASDGSKALAHSPRRKALAHNLDRNVFARNHDSHHVTAHRLGQKPRGTDRLVAKCFAVNKPRSCLHRGLARCIAARRRACRPVAVPTSRDTLAKTRHSEE
jgi:hypothetical protein